MLASIYRFIDCYLVGVEWVTVPNGRDEFKFNNVSLCTKNDSV